MDDETQQIFEEQLKKLPIEVVDFLSSANWDGDIDEIGSLYNLSEDETYDLHREATFVLAGLVHPDDFGDNLEKEAGIHGAVRDAITTAVEQKIFAPVRGALVEFLKEEEGREVESGDQETTHEEVPRKPSLTPQTSNLTPARAPQLSGAAPDNLPTGETEPLIPPIPPKSANLEVEPPSEHPFEEKMKRVFTAGQQSMGELTLEPAAPATPTPTRRANDPYREAIE